MESPCIGILHSVHDTQGSGWWEMFCDKPHIVSISLNETAATT